MEPVYVSARAYPCHIFAVSPTLLMWDAARNRRVVILRTYLLVSNYAHGGKYAAQCIMANRCPVSATAGTGDSRTTSSISDSHACVAGSAGESPQPDAI